MIQSPVPEIEQKCDVTRTWQHRHIGARWKGWPPELENPTPRRNVRRQTAAASQQPHLPAASGSRAGQGSARGNATE